MVLYEIDGCFVCFGGNMFLIGKIDQEFFIFDLYVRCFRGYVSFIGKSIRIIFKDVEEVFFYINLLVLFMGYLRIVECELSGVLCKFKEFCIGEVCVEESESILKQGLVLLCELEIGGLRRKLEEVNLLKLDCILLN